MSNIEPSQTTLKLYERGHEAFLKFDYFVCSVAGAIFAYTAEHYSPKRFALDVSLLEPLSLLLLTLSFGCGFRRLYLAAFGTHINHDLNDSDEKVGQILELLENPEYKEDARKLMESERRNLFDHARACEVQLSGVVGSARKFQFLRDIFLIVGFATIFLAKVLQPYETNYIPPCNAIYHIMNVTPPQGHPQAIQENTPMPPKGMLPAPSDQPSIYQPHQATSSLSTPSAKIGTNPQQKPMLPETNQP